MKAWCGSFMVLLLACMSVQADQSRYDVETGYVEYESVSTLKVGGQEIRNTSQTKVLFSDWGAIEIQEKTTDHGGMVDTELSKQDGEIYYSVDFDRQVIVKATLQEMGLASDDTGQPVNPKSSKAGTETILGYPCYRVEAEGIQSWYYRGVMLKQRIKTDVMTVETLAKKAVFEDLVDASVLAFPDYPIVGLYE
ncbi:MAG: hypothetical protein ABW068_14735 [Candidatus Thiodiazotropha sp.]